MRSLNDDSPISNRENLYEIGFSRGPAEKRLTNAEMEPTYLMAPVEFVGTCGTYNLKVSAFEDRLHRVFSKVRLDTKPVDGRGNIFDPLGMVLRTGERHWPGKRPDRFRWHC
ncbi:hypothetical protein GCM10009715_33640 [Paeniglutamicibacter psychrophenolicus]